MKHVNINFAPLQPRASKKPIVLMVTLTALSVYLLTGTTAAMASPGARFNISPKVLRAKVGLALHTAFQTPHQTPTQTPHQTPSQTPHQTPSQKPKFNKFRQITPVAVVKNPQAIKTTQAAKASFIKVKAIHTKVKQPVKQSAQQPSVSKQSKVVKSVKEGKSKVDAKEVESTVTPITTEVITTQPVSVGSEVVSPCTQ